MKNRDSERSDEIVRTFLERSVHLKRKVQIFEKVFSAPPIEVFSQFCPAREADWINGWTVDLLYTKTGYVEPLCVFRTPASNILGPGLWIITRIEPCTYLEAVVFQQENGIVEYFKIHVFDYGDGTCKGIWDITVTAINEKGNGVIESIPDEEPAFLAELEYFLVNGKLMVQQS